VDPGLFKFVQIYLTTARSARMLTGSLEAEAQKGVRRSGMSRVYRSTSMQALSLRRRIVGVLSIGIAIVASSVILSPLRVSAFDGNVAASVKSAPATHKQKTIVTVANIKDGEKLEDFCIDSKGRILALVGPGNAAEMGLTSTDDSFIGGALSLFTTSAKTTAKKKPKKVESEVRVYDATGKLAEQWAVGFSAQAINTAPDGTVVVGGDGRVARFDAGGKKLLESESPQMTYISKNPEEMRARAKEQLESDRATYAEQVKQYEDQLKELKASKKNAKDEKESKTEKKPKNAKEDEDEDEGDAVDLNAPMQNEQTLKVFINAYKQQLKSLEARTIDQVLQQVLGRAKRIHAISADDKNVFVTCPAMAGYGYGVWRTDTQFAQAKEIVKSLSGCCGQMDVQCRNGELYVCENSRHRVVKFDSDGKELAHFGKHDREGEGENFGGCCNPMNLCFNKDGNLYVSESNGSVKHFTTAGKYLGVVGVANVQPGCKNSCVAVTADDSRLFYIDIEKSQIIVLAREEASKTN
jgi:hypothetical protein